MQFLGIYREPEYSPGRHTSNDAKILRLVGQALAREGHEVRLTGLDEARPLRKQAELIFSMCQGPNALTELHDWKKEGCRIVNDPEASRRTYRDNLCSSILEKDLDFPHSEFLQTDIHPKELERYRVWFEGGLGRRSLGEGGWLKRSDVHATQTSDVIRLQKWSDLNAGLTAFRLRGLKQAVLQQHCAGDEVKFYAVKSDRLFWPYYPKDSEGFPFDGKELQRLAEHAANALDIAIYGGDAIIAADGTITLIDLNDWPSFAPCRGAAASAIARFLKDQLDALQRQRKVASI